MDQKLENFLCDFFKNKTKSTLHFDKLAKVKKTDKSDKNCTLNDLLSKKQQKDYREFLDRDSVARYGFLPFIHYKIIERRVSKIKKNKKSISNTLYKQGKETNKIKKERPIHYASHRANLIYAWYAHQLQEKYESYVKNYENNSEKLKLSDMVLAYRSVDDTEKNNYQNHETHYDKHPRTNNITMAREAFDEISKRIDDKGCYVFAYDLEGFFNHLDHKKLYKAWADLLETKSLPKDYLNVFKSLTKFSYINLLDLYKFFKDDLKETEIFTKGKSYKVDGKDKTNYQTRTGIFCQSKKGIIYGEKHTLKALKIIFEKEVHPKFKEFKENFTKKFKIYKNQDPFGIPQGTPISAVLANIYMLEFDKAMLSLCGKYDLFYRRYSDDILIVAPHNEDILTIIKNRFEGKDSFFQRILGKSLKIHPIESKKSQLIAFDTSEKTKVQRISYLGFDFEFDPKLKKEKQKRVYLRQSGVAKYFRKSIMWIRSSTRGLLKNKIYSEIQPNTLYKKKILSLYSGLKITYKNPRHRFGNYLTYVYEKSFKSLDESSYYDSTKLKSPMKTHLKRIYNLIDKAERLFKSQIFFKQKYPFRKMYQKHLRKHPLKTKNIYE